MAATVEVPVQKGQVANKEVENSESSALIYFIESFDDDLLLFDCVRFAKWNLPRRCLLQAEVFLEAFL